jgi:hypothetical protein
MRLARRLTAWSALVFTICWAFALAFAGSTDVLLFLAPALLIVAPLIAGRYPGEELIVKLGRRSGRPRRTAAGSSQAAPPSPSLWLPRGARLIAFSLAERPPPARLLAQT